MHRCIVGIERRRQPGLRNLPTVRLNPEQRLAVEHGSDALAAAGPLLVIAGAGTGKTATLAHRVAWLIANGVPPDRLLLLTFSRRAAAEMVRRAGSLLANDNPVLSARDRFVLPWAGTFHSVAASVLRRHGARLGLNRDFTILDRGDCVDCIDWLRTELALDASGSRFPRASTCLDIYSDRINTGQALDTVLSERYPWCVQWRESINRLLRAYVGHKHAQALLDYDDLLLWWRLGMDEPGFSAVVRAHFDHVLVDEYQDSNRLQVELLTALRPDGRGLFVVGDDAQSIYSFRGADVEHIYRFSRQFAPPARRISLMTNYRSTQPVLDTANALIAGAGGPYDKSLVAANQASGPRPRLVTVLDDAAQSAWVIACVLGQREAGIPLRHQAVLFRNSHHSDSLEIDLTRHNIPFVKYGGLKFVEAAHVKDAIALLRWSVNPRDTLAGFRALQLISGIGPAIAREVLLRIARDATIATSASALLDATLRVGPRGVAAAQWTAFTALIRSLADARLSVNERLLVLADWMVPVIEERYAEPQARCADLQMLATIGAGYVDIPSLIAALALDPPGATGGFSDDALIDEDYLILSTVHSAKGQEWHNVMVINVADGNFPNEFATSNTKAVAEERRLLYVAMTRARHQLHLIEPVRYYLTRQPRLGGAHVYGARSRFLDTDVLATVECIGREGVDSPVGSVGSLPTTVGLGLPGDAEAVPTLVGKQPGASAVFEKMWAFWPE